MSDARGGGREAGTLRSRKAVPSDCQEADGCKSQQLPWEVRTRLEGFLLKPIHPLELLMEWPVLSQLPAPTAVLLRVWSMRERHQHHLQSR